MSLKMLALKKNIRSLFRSWLRDEEALAGTEAAMIFPLMLTLFLGLYDVGNGILANQKTIRASQIVADLIARKNVVTGADVNEAVKAGELAFEPMPQETYGVDIISVRFDPDTSDPEIVWRDTRNMTPIPDVFDRVSPLGLPGEGVVVVAVTYSFEPVFAGFVVDTFDMMEVGFSRGRSSPVVNHE
jgi:hypothetical protein